MNITDFLLARITEDEAKANQIISEWERAERDLDKFDQYICDPIIGPFGGQSQLRNFATGTYLAGMAHPRRVLAECAAKRATIANTTGGRREQFEATLRALAAIYSDHPDYNPAWRDE